MSNVQDIAEQVISLPSTITFGGVGIWTIFVFLVTVFVRYWPVMKRLQNESDASLRTDLMKRVKELEDRLRDEQRDCEKEIAALRSKLDGVLRQFLQYQLAVGQAVPPERRSPEIDSALESLRSSLNQGDGI